MFGRGAKIERSKSQLEEGPYYEVIRTRGGSVGVVYDHADRWAPRDALLHAATDAGSGSPSDTALSILAHHFQIQPQRALRATFGTPQSSGEELLAKLYSHFLEEFVLAAQTELPPDCSFVIHSEVIREWADMKFKTGAVRW